MHPVNERREKKVSQWVADLTFRTSHSPVNWTYLLVFLKFGPPFFQKAFGIFPIRVGKGRSGSVLSCPRMRQIALNQHERTLTVVVFVGTVTLHSSLKVEKEEKRWISKRRSRPNTNNL